MARNLLYRTETDLRMLRAELNITQAKAAALFGVSRKTFQNWEAGRYPRNLAELYAVVADKHLPHAPRGRPKKEPFTNMFNIATGEHLSQEALDALPDGSLAYFVYERSGNPGVSDKAKRNGIWEYRNEIFYFPASLCPLWDKIKDHPDVK